MIRLVDRPVNARVLVILSTLVGTMLLAIFGCTAEGPEPPESKQVAVVDTFHGTVVTEHFRWLENFDHPEVQTWTEEQNVHTRQYFDHVSQRDDIRSALADLYADASSRYYSLKQVGDRLFAMKTDPPREQPLLVVLDSPEELSSERAIIDLNTYDTTYSTAIDFYVPSPDGELVAVSLSKHGSEDGTVYVFETETGQRLSDVVTRVNGPTAGGDVAWNQDGTGFWYTRYPHKGERSDEDLRFYQQVYYHELGTDGATDRYAVGQEFPRIAEIQLERSDNGRYILATVSDGDGGEYAHFLRTPGDSWVQVTDFKDRITKAHFGPDALYMLSLKNSPHGKIVRIPLDKPSLTNATVVIAESDAVIKTFLPTGRHLYTVDLYGGPSRLRQFDIDGANETQVPVKPVSSVSGLVEYGDGILYENTTYTEPPAWFAYDPGEQNPVRTALVVESAANYDGVIVERKFATSKDGTRVPVNIIRHEDTQFDNLNPTLLYGYGGYGISLSPRFSSDLSLWLQNGGVYAVANIRGGGEFGEEWHLQGNLTEKQNVFDDFIAAAEMLIDSGYTNPGKLAIKGGSNGGLLMGAVTTQRPDLFRAVVASVGIYDMLRVELDPNGEFNITEFGTVENPDQFKALYAYSPYHNVKDDTDYPAVLLMTGLYDGRVNPMQSRKMAARLQEATASNQPVLLRTSYSTGHGRGTALSEEIELEADVYSFLFNELGVSFTPPN